LTNAEKARKKLYAWLFYFLSEPRIHAGTGIFPVEEMTRDMASGADVRRIRK